MLPWWANDTITVIEPSWKDDRGTLVPDYEAPESARIVSGCSVQDGGSDEVMETRQNVIVRYTVYAPFLEISPHAAVVVGGERFSVDGEPDEWEWPNGENHIVLALVDWRG